MKSDNIVIDFLCNTSHAICVFFCGDLNNFFVDAVGLQYYCYILKTQTFAQNSLQITTTELNLKFVLHTCIV